jgi:hypothetical protein
MIFTDYYLFEKLPNQKSKSRIDCTASTQSYNPLEILRNKSCELFLYLGNNTHTMAGKERKADLALTRTTHISSVFVPDVTTDYGYGDFNDTSDALLFVFKNFKIMNGRIVDGAIVEVFVARGQRNNRAQLYNLLFDGELDEEMTALRLIVTDLVTA